MYDRAKHINTRVYRVRELASGEAPEVAVYKIAGEYQPAFSPRVCLVWPLRGSARWRGTSHFKGGIERWF